MSNKLTIKELITSLQSTSEYEGLSPHYIDKALKEKYHLKTVKKENYVHELALIKQRQPIPNAVDLPQDVYYELLLQSSFNDIKQLCFVNKPLAKICSKESFWHTILTRDGLPIFDNDFKSIEGWIRHYDNTKNSAIEASDIKRILTIYNTVPGYHKIKKVTIAHQSRRFTRFVFDLFNAKEDNLWVTLTLAFGKTKITISFINHQS